MAAPSFQWSGPKPSVSLGLFSFPPTPQPIQQQILWLDFQNRPRTCPLLPTSSAAPGLRHQPCPGGDTCTGPSPCSLLLPWSCFTVLPAGQPEGSIQTQVRWCHLTQHPSTALHLPGTRQTTSCGLKTLQPLLPTLLPSPTLLHPPWPPSRSTEVPVHARTPGPLH